MSVDEAALLQAWAAGDKRTGEQLFARYYKPLTRLFANKVRSTDEVEELVQRSFMVGHRAVMTRPPSTLALSLLLLSASGCRGSDEAGERVAQQLGDPNAPLDARAPGQQLTPLDQVEVGADEVVDVQGSKMLLDPQDTVVSRVIKRDGIWEPLETELFIRELRAGDIVVDAGANIGYYTLLAARLVGPAGHVYAFEPEPNAFALLERNIALNGYTNVTAMPKALGRAPGSLQLFLATRNRGDHRVYDPSGKRTSIDVEVVRLDDVLPAQAVAQVDFMKIDTQGAECAILEGAAQTIETARELALVMEFTPSSLIALGDSPRACLERLTDAGFGLVDIREWQRQLVPTDIETLLTRYPEHDSKRFTNLFLPRRTAP